VPQPTQADLAAAGVLDDATSGKSSVFHATAAEEVYIEPNVGRMLRRTQFESAPLFGLLIYLCTLFST
jgi:hypothetical protein